MKETQNNQRVTSTKSKERKKNERLNTHYITLTKNKCET